MAPRPQRRLPLRPQTLRPRRTRREPQPPRRGRHHDGLPTLHALERRRASDPGQHGLVEPVRRRGHVSGQGGPVRHLRVGCVLRAGGEGVRKGDGGEGVTDRP